MESCTWHGTNVMFPIENPYTTNPTGRSAAATECSASESDLESSVESHRAMAEQVCQALGERSLSARCDSKGDSKSLSLVERSVGLVV